MILTRTALVIFTVVSAHTASSMCAQAIAPNPAMQRYTVKMVPMEYPTEARRGRLEGRGVLVGEVDFDTGKVTSVRMEKSTGHKILDDAALRSFRQWQFKPRLLKQFRTPVTYSMANRT